MESWEHEKGGERKEIMSTGERKWSRDQRCRRTTKGRPKAAQKSGLDPSMRWQMRDFWGKGCGKCRFRHTARTGPASQQIIQIRALRNIKRLYSGRRENMITRHAGKENATRLCFLSQKRETKVTQEWGENNAVNRVTTTEKINGPFRCRLGWRILPGRSRGKHCAMEGEKPSNYRLSAAFKARGLE